MIEYCGELLSTAEASLRLSRQPPNAYNYLLVVREHYALGDCETHCCITCIDATLIGNRARFVNHTCAREPPLVLVPVRTRSQFGFSESKSIESVHQCSSSNVSTYMWSSRRFSSLPPARAALFAARNIADGDELLFDYAAVVGERAAHVPRSPLAALPVSRA